METPRGQRLSRDQRLQIQTLRSTNMTYEAIARVPKAYHSIEKRWKDFLFN